MISRVSQPNNNTHWILTPSHMQPFFHIVTKTIERIIIEYMPDVQCFPELSNSIFVTIAHRVSRMKTVSCFSVQSSPKCPHPIWKTPLIPNVLHKVLLHHLSNPCSYHSLASVPVDIPDFLLSFEHMKSIPTSLLDIFSA